MEWQEVSGNSGMWTPKNKGDFIQGMVIEVREGQYGKQITVKDANNVTYLTPSHKALQSRIADIKVNDIIKIEFQGQDLPKVKGQMGTMLYKVFKQKELEVKIEEVK